MFNKSIAFLATLVLLSVFTFNSTDAQNKTKFKLIVENITSGNVLKSKSGDTAPLAFSPGFWIVHTIDAPVFRTGEKDWKHGLESLAEDGNPEPQVNFCKTHKGVVSSGLYNTPVGAEMPGPITPGTKFEFTFEAEANQRLTTGFMWGQSNDLFYAPNERGIALFDKSGKAIGGDITNQFILWDAGTEINEEPGFGPNQGPRQGGMNIGPDENGVVTAVVDGWSYPRTSEVLRITITPVSDTIGKR